MYIDTTPSCNNETTERDCSEWYRVGRIEGMAGSRSKVRARVRLTTLDIATAIGVSDRTVRRWIARGWLRGRRVFGDLRRERRHCMYVVRPAALRRLLAERPELMAKALAVKTKGS